jgi:ribosomal protein L11 methyltransferase
VAPTPPHAPHTWPALEIAGIPPADAADLHQAAQGDLLQAALVDFDVEAIDESAPAGWRVFFRTAAERDRAHTALAAEFPGLTFAAADIADEDWAARSQASLKAVRVGQLIVAPPWDVPVVITIRPSMGFGTGHHATTRLCLAALQAVEVTRRSVIDVGTGSGVLAIAASLLGAVEVRGIDDDADAIHAAWDNLALNPAAVVSLLVGDLRSTSLEPADLVFGNLTGGLLMASSDVIRALAAPRGRLILSGFQTHEEAAVVASFAPFVVERREDEDSWVCVTLKADS